MRFHVHDTSATPMRSLGNMPRRIGVTLLGVVLLFTAVFGATYTLSHQLHQDHTGNVLLASQRANTAKIQQQNHGAACTVSDVKEGQLGGILSIPAIHLQAPVEEGTEDQELNVAVGTHRRRSGPA